MMDRFVPIPADLAMAPRQEGLCAELRRQSFDQVVLLRVINHGLSGLDGHNSNLSVNMAVRATLIHVADATQGESFYAQYSGAERKFTEWAANNGQFFQEEFERGLRALDVARCR